LIIPLILNWQLNCIKKDEEEKMNAVKIGNYPARRPGLYQMRNLRREHHKRNEVRLS
jgi:hypothetical protein